MKTSSKARRKEKYEIRTKVIPVPSIIEVSQKGRRIKVNFMVDAQLLKALSHYVPNGGKSDFLNEILEKALIHYKRKKAFQAMDELREREKLRLSTAEFIKLKNYGRE